MEAIRQIRLLPRIQVAYVTRITPVRATVPLLFYAVSRARHAQPPP